MLRRLKPAKAIVNRYVALDIENNPDGSIVCIDIYDGKRHILTESWQDAIDVLLTAEDDSYHTVYAHNGGGWDWLSLIEYFLSVPSTERPIINCILNGSKLIMVTLIYGDKTIQLMDSMHLFYCGLDTIATKLLGKGKLEADVSNFGEYYRKHREKALQYVYHDTELLYRCIEKFGDLIFNHIAPISGLGVTLPATALRIFRSMMPCDIMTPADDKLRFLLRQGYTGGRVEVFNPGKHNVFVYDINSLYPYVMSDTPVPISANGRWYSDCDWQKLTSVCGVFEVQFSQHNRNIPAVLLKQGKGVYSGEGTYFTPELELLYNQGADIRIKEGFEFSNVDLIFSDYVTKLYKLRMENKGGPLDTICKLLLNSLYGKFGQKPERQRMIFASSFDEIMEYVENGGVELINPELGLYCVTEESHARHEHVGIAGMITSTARKVLYEGFNSGLVYCDTDSVHTTIPFSDNSINSKLGFWKLEYQGVGVYAGKKLYALGSKIRAKGVKVGGKFGSELDFSDIERLLYDAKIACRFQTATSPREVMKGKSACQFRQRKRTLRKTY